MKRCPECRRDYYDDTLLYCLDDGNSLLEGPATMDEPATAILHTTDAVGDAPTRAQIHTTGQTAALPSGISGLPKRSFDKRLLAIPFLLAVIALGGFFSYRYFSTTKQIESIAVMPFVNESGNADVEYLSDGMTETLINSLSQLPNLNVQARSSVFRYKGKDTDTKAIGKELNVQALLSGRVVQRGDDLILYLELVDAQTGKRIWGDKYNRKQNELITLQSEIARDVSSKLKSKLSGAEAAKVEKSYTANPEAYQFYLKGRFYVARRTPQDVRKAIEYYLQAIALDQSYALPFAALAEAYYHLSSYGGATPHEAFPKAKEATLRALSLDNDLAEAHSSLCNIFSTYDYDFDRAERECRRGIELSPNDAAAHHFYGLLLTRLGRHEESFAEFHRALEIEPLSLVINKNYGESLFYARRYEESVEQFKRTLELDANFAPTYPSLATAYQAMGRYAEYIEALARSEELLNQPQSGALIRETFAKDGWQGIRRMMSKETLLSTSSYAVAVYLAESGEKDRAIAALNNAYENRLYRVGHIKVDPRLDALRSDPGFQELMRKVGFPY
ncbi:MAG: hypothetical protein WKF34_14490 [Pyrinomonadaceae bacterium]